MRLPSSDRVPADAIAGTVVTLFGLAYTAIALGIPADRSQASVIGPAVFPLLFGGALTLGGLALLAGALRRARGRRAPVGAVAPPPPDAPPADVPGVVPGPRRSLWVLVALLTGYVLLFLPLGFLLATALFLIVMMTYLRPRTIAVNLLFAVLLPTAVYLLFGFGLQITLPAGVLSGVLP